MRPFHVRAFVRASSKSSVFSLAHRPKAHHMDGLAECNSLTSIMLVLAFCAASPISIHWEGEKNSQQSLHSECVCPVDWRMYVLAVLLEGFKSHQSTQSMVALFFSAGLFILGWMGESGRQAGNWSVGGRAGGRLASKQFFDFAKRKEAHNGTSDGSRP